VSASNFTDDNGVQNMGVNARIGLVPWKGFSMDDAMPISASFAKRMSAIQYKVVKQEASDNLKTGLSHYRAQFPLRFTKEKLAQFEENGLVRKGTILEPGDPIVLGTMPRTLSSVGANVGKLSKALKQSRRDASTVWEGHQPAEVVESRQTKNGVKVVLRYVKPTEEGDKLTIRAGAKATVSRIIPDDQMPRTADGQPLDVMLNPLSLVSRANPSSQHEMRLGKIAKKLGAPLKIPSFLPKGQNWNDYIDNMEKEHGVESTEQIFDPMANRFLTNPVTVGYAFINKLHHVSSGKLSSRGNGSYDGNLQPARGPGEFAQAKRFSGLENFATLSSGAYALMRENSTLRGTKNDAYWKDLRAGKPLPKVGVPFVWNKFRALLSGAGMSTREIGKGRYRLAPFTDKDLDNETPIDVDTGDLVNISTMDTIKGGLFDPRIVTGDKWGRIRLPRPIINPAMEDGVRALLGLTKQELDNVLAGRMELPPQLKNRLATLIES
jgi:DNA-directed RNA polymerase subunit beta